MRLGFITDTTAVNSNYRAYQPMMALSRRGHAVRHNTQGQVSSREWEGFDAILIHRFSNPEAMATVKLLQAAGVAVIWDNDDDLASLPKASSRLGSRGAAARRRALSDGVRRMVRLADLVSTPSESLAGQYRALGASEVRVIENFVPDSFVDVRGKRSNGVVVAWLAGLEHQIDYEQLGLREVLHRLLGEHPQMQVLSIGLGLGLPPERYVHRPLVDFLDLPSRLAIADIGVAPLVDIPWNRARSNVKLKEYASVGIPWLASPVGAYRSHGSDEGGRLVSDDDWYASLDALIRSGRDRRRLGKRAKSWAKNQTIARNVSHWEDAFTEAVERARFRRG